MITEDYCSYEVSKLLKEKGFEINTTFYYADDGEKHRNYEHVTGYKGYYSCPTHQMAMKWLRENEIFVLPDVRTADGKWFCMIVRLLKEVDNGCTGERRAMGYYDTYEEAVEAALKYCLTELI